MLCVHKSIPQNMKGFEPVEVPLSRSRPDSTSQAARRNRRCDRSPHGPIGNSGSTSAARSPTALLAAPTASLTHYKVLSSGVIKGAVAPGSSRRADRRPGAIRRSRRLLDRLSPAAARRAGQYASRIDRRAASIRAADDLRLAAPLPSDPPPGSRYELSADVEAPIVAIRYLLGLPLAAPIPPVAVRLGTTRGTNALLTRRGAQTALVTTRGFGDILHIGYQNRPRLFDLAIRKPRAAVRRRGRNRRAHRRRRAGARWRPTRRRFASNWPSSGGRASSRWPSACCTPSCARPTKSSSADAPARSASTRSASPAASRR